MRLLIFRRFFQLSNISPTPQVLSKYQYLFYSESYSRLMKQRLSFNKLTMIPMTLVKCICLNLIVVVMRLDEINQKEDVDAICH